MRDKPAPVNPVTHSERSCLPCGSAKSTMPVKAKQARSNPSSPPPSAALTWHGLSRVTRPEGTRSGLRQTADGTTDGGISPSAKGSRWGPPCDSSREALVPVPDLLRLQALLEGFKTGLQLRAFSHQRLQRGTPLISLPLFFDNVSLHLL